jgi:hypothetical protein
MASTSSRAPPSALYPASTPSSCPPSLYSTPTAVNVNRKEEASTKPLNIEVCIRMMKSSISLCFVVVISTLGYIPCKSFSSPYNSKQTKMMPRVSSLAMSSENYATNKSCGQSANTTSRSRRLYTFNEARKIARGHGFDSRQEFLEYACPGAYQIPKDADVVWKDDWRGWDDFLGVPLGFEEVRLVCSG